MAGLDSDHKLDGGEVGDVLLTCDGETVIAHVATRERGYIAP